ncbi:MAG: GAF domain-containing protein, partial [Quisquiliibacterium sp.]
MLASANRLLGTTISAILSYENGLMDMAAHSGWSQEALDRASHFYPGPPNPAMLSGRVILTGKVQTINDTLTDKNYDSVTAHAAPWRRMLGVPMRSHHGRTVGAIVVGWSEPGVNSSRERALLQTFAEQAAIAIGNARLFRQTMGALERQTATSVVLKAISNSISDAQPVFEQIIQSTLRLVPGRSAAIFLAPGDGLLHCAEIRGLNWAEH